MLKIRVRLLLQFGTIVTPKRTMGGIVKLAGHAVESVILLAQPGHEDLDLNEHALRSHFLELREWMGHAHAGVLETGMRGRRAALPVQEIVFQIIGLALAEHERAIEAFEQHAQDADERVDGSLVLRAAVP